MGGCFSAQSEDDPGIEGGIEEGGQAPGLGKYFHDIWWGCFGCMMGSVNTAQHPPSCGIPPNWVEAQIAGTGSNGNPWSTNWYNGNQVGRSGPDETLVAGTGAVENQVGGTRTDARLVDTYTDQGEHSRIQMEEAVASQMADALTDYAQLTDDVLWLISKKVQCSFDYTYFRAVCKPWRAAASSSQHPPFLPILLESDMISAAYRKVYSVHSGKTHLLHVPELQYKAFHGQSNGLIVTYQSYEVPIRILPSSDIIIFGQYMIPAIQISLTDKITTDLILPRGQAIPAVKNPFNYVIPEGRHRIPTILNPFTKAQRLLPFIGFEIYSPLHLGPNAIHEGEAVLLAMEGHGISSHLGYWNAKANRWLSRGITRAEARAVHRGMVFHFHLPTGVTTAVKITTGQVIMVVALPPGVRRFYGLIEANGVLFGIVQHYMLSKVHPCHDCTFEVFQLHVNSETAFWFKVKDLQDTVLFLNGRSGFALAAEEFGGITGNCIYFTKSNGLDGSLHSTIIGRYHLGNKNSEVVGMCKISHGTWIVPRIF